MVEGKNLLSFENATYLINHTEVAESHINRKTYFICDTAARLYSRRVAYSPFQLILQNTLIYRFKKSVWYIHSIIQATFVVENKRCH